MVSDRRCQQIIPRGYLVGKKATGATFEALAKVGILTSYDSFKETGDRGNGLTTHKGAER